MCVSYPSHSTVISPEVPNPRRRQEIIDRLQLYTAPNVFNPRALFDGRAIMFSTRDLLPGGAARVSV
jgi:eukaryotic translation initiation factor 2C